MNIKSLRSDQIYRKVAQASPEDEMLASIATTYKFDARFKSYINQYSDEDLAEFLYSAIMHHIRR